ncbi:class IV adenylate cyclase [Patescibacteria group bacterium]|nr:class IV adenylate cyclase [Patescibacteria group bacterium]
MDKEKDIIKKSYERLEKEAEPKEIERKFLINSLPENLEQYPKKEIIQGYIIITKDGTEVRLRKKGEKYFETIKTGKGKTRTESEIEITEEQFNKLWPETKEKRVEKTRYEIPYKYKNDKEANIELDLYHGDLNGLLSAEVEFESEDSSVEFDPPEWFDKEVTYDKNYKNQNLALHGIPKEKNAKKGEIKEILDIPRYELENGIEKLKDAIEEKLEKEEGSIIVEIAGGSASGKTTAVAHKIKKAFSDSSLIFSMDDYYMGKKFMETEDKKGNTLNWDQPEALNLELLQKHLMQLKKGESIQKPIYDMKLSESIETEELKPKKIIILEGLFALNDLIKNEGDIKVFVDIGTHGRIIRRLLRDIERTNQKPADILNYFSEIVEPMHEKYIEQSKKNADMIIVNEYSPGIEAQKSGLHEIQLKFKADIDQEKLRKIGAEKLSSTQQIDNYYNPSDRNLIETEEILRIREEAGHRTLTYKGPKIESKFRKKPKFEFEIDKKTEERFLSIYGDKIKTIKKDRTIYELNRIIFSIDVVSKIEDDKEIELGNFVEIRSTNEETEESQIEKIISDLGLKTKEGIKESYFEM